VPQGLPKDLTRCLISSASAQEVGGYRVISAISAEADTEGLTRLNLDRFALWSSAAQVRKSRPEFRDKPSHLDARFNCAALRGSAGFNARKTGALRLRSLPAHQYGANRKHESIA